MKKYLSIEGKKEAKRHSQIVDCRNLSEGVYFLRFYSTRFVLTKKLVLAK
ncbi:MAG: hypothetical protein ABIK84_01270 [candidate division WOR-3 bacterium]